MGPGREGGVPPRAVAAGEGGAWGGGTRGTEDIDRGGPNPVKWHDERCGTGAAESR